MSCSFRPYLCVLHKVWNTTGQIWPLNHPRARPVSDRVCPFWALICQSRQLQFSFSSLYARSLACDWWRWRERKKRMNKEREKMVRGGAASYVAEYPGASASPHILPIFKMDMRVRRQPRRTWMIRGVRLGRVFSSLSCLVTDQTRLRAYEAWFEMSGCRCSNIVVQLHTGV